MKCRLYGVYIPQSKTQILDLCRDCPLLIHHGEPVEYENKKSDPRFSLLIHDKGKTQDYYYIRKMEKVRVNARKFVTKKGREAIEVWADENGKYEMTVRSGGGDRTWNGWSARKPVNALFAHACATSNGGGHWVEVIITEVGKPIITARDKEYIEELGMEVGNE